MTAVLINREPAPKGDRTRRLGLAVVELLGIFITDMLLPNSVVFGAFYAVPLLFCFHRARRREVIVLAAVSSILAPLGAFYGGDGWADPNPNVIVSALTAAFAIWVTAGLVLTRLTEEEQLIATRELNEIALGATEEAVVVTDAQGIVTWINRAAESMLGWRRVEAEGRSLSDVYRRVDDETVTRAPELPVDVIIARTRSGARLPVEETTGVIRDLQGAPLGHVVVLRDASKRESLERELRQMAFRDRLTGLPNRTLLAERLGLELDHATRDQHLLAVLFIDLDHFKEVNDTLGHQAGDDLLRGVGSRLKECLRSADTVARLSGDEFVIVTPGIHTRDDAALVAKKVCAALSEPFHLGSHERTVLPSIGIAMFPEHGVAAEVLVKRADGAMYLAKHRGGGTYAFADGVEDGPSTGNGEDDAPEDD